MHSVDFKFAKTWRHAGIDYKEGDVAKLSPRKADKLVKAKAGEIVKAAKSPFDAQAPIRT